MEDREITNEFMLEEYRQLYEERRAATTFLDQRVNYFLSIASVFIGGVVVLVNVTTTPTDYFNDLVMLGLFILLLYGLYIFHRVISRDIRQRKIVLILHEIMAHFSAQDKEMSKYVERRKEIFRRKKHKSKVLSVLLERIRGGLIDLVILSNALICGGIMFIRQINSGNILSSSIVVAVFTFLLCQIFLYSYRGLLNKLY